MIAKSISSHNQHHKDDARNNSYHYPPDETAPASVCHIPVTYGLPESGKSYFAHVPKGDNFKFYSCAQGHEILNVKNFSLDILHFLKEECNTIQYVLRNRKNKYDALLEVGCGRARNIGLSMSLGLNYFGLDFVEKEIKAAQYKIKAHSLVGVVKCMSALDLNHVTTPVPPEMKTICLFPFNVFGNIAEPMRLFHIMHYLNYDVLISTYQHDAQEDMILQYYETCGLNMQVVPLNKGTLFISQEGFKSIIYTSEYIEQLANQFDFVMDTYQLNKLGKLYYIRCAEKNGRKNVVNF